MKKLVEGLNSDTLISYFSTGVLKLRGIRREVLTARDTVFVNDSQQHF